MASNSSSGGVLLWYQFEACAAAPYAFVFYFGVKVLNLAVGAPANALLLWHMASRGSRTSRAATSDVFMAQLAVLDAFFCLMTPLDMLNRLLLGRRRLWFLQMFAYGLKDAAPLFLVCICVDRYVAVVHPLLFGRIRDNRLRACAAAAAWGLVLSYGLAKCVLGAVSVTQAFSAIILFSFAAMLLCNGRLLWALRRSAAAAGREASHPVKRRAFRTLLLALAIVVLNYLPPVALMPFASYYSFVQFRCQISVSVFAIMDLSCSLEPLLYMAKTHSRSERKPQSVAM